MSFSKVLDPTKVFDPTKVLDPPGFEGVDPKKLKGHAVWKFIYHAKDNLPEGINKCILSNFICGGYGYFNEIHCEGDNFEEQYNESLPLRCDYELRFNSKDVTITDFYYLASKIVGFNDSFFNWDGYYLMNKGDNDPHKNNMKEKLIENNIIEEFSKLPKTKKEGINYYHNGNVEFYEKDNTLNRNNITRSIIMLFLEAIMNKDKRILEIFFFNPV